MKTLRTSDKALSCKYLQPRAIMVSFDGILRYVVVCTNTALAVQSLKEKMERVNAMESSDKKDLLTRMIRNAPMNRAIVEDPNYCRGCSQWSDS